MYRATELIKWIFLYCSLSQCVATRRILEDSRPHFFLHAGDIVENNGPGLKTYCHNANTKYLTQMWRTMTMHLNINTKSYVLYDGKTPYEIHQKHDDNNRLWNWFDTGTHKQLRINPFENTCIGIYIDSSIESEYTITLEETRVDAWSLTMMIIGIIIFWFARRLSRNSIFYYTCGITLGVTLSLLLVTYMAGKLIPRGKVMYIMISISMSVYLTQLLWDNAQLILIQYKEWLMYYILITSMGSFIICYRFGPVTNPRTKQIIQWFLQLVGLILIYKSSHFHEASFSSCFILVLLYNFSKAIFEKGKKYWRNIFPEKRILLSENQYREEGIRQTRKALKELQNYCSSPECNPWKTILKLKDPIRFAKFMEGESHLSENEIDEHEEEISKILDNDEYTDDEDDFYTDTKST